MEFEDIQRQGEKEPFSFDFFLAAEKKTAEVQVFLDIGERAFGLDGSVDTQEFGHQRAVPPAFFPVGCGGRQD